MSADERQGKIVKGLGGLYEVRCPRGDGADRFFCRARGSFKKDDGKLMVGDDVVISGDGSGGMVIDELLPRRNSLIRPPVSNIDRLFIVMAVHRPEPVLETVDKLTAIAFHNDIVPAVIVTKSDYSSEAAEEYADIYRRCGIDAFSVSSAAGEGIEELGRYIRTGLAGGGTAAFAGASGVGKSTLMNRLFPRLSLTTSDVSRKTERGRHTTRHVELFEIGEGSDPGFIADTPGFSLIDFSRFDFFSLGELLPAFPEFLPYAAKCRYSDCSHVGEGEEDCAVARAVRDGSIPESRKKSYEAIYAALKSKNSFK